MPVMAAGPDESTLSLYGVSAADPAQELVDRSGADEADLAQIDRIMAAMGRLRTVERAIAEASQAYMGLKETDMRALHYLLIAENQGITVTAGDLARHLQITTASITKLLDRLERDGHVVRHRHPSDRRALTLTVTPQTRRSAMATVGRQHASRYGAAVRLTPEEREVVIRYLSETADDLAATLEEAATVHSTSSDSATHRRGRRS